MSSWSTRLRRLRDEAATWRRCARCPGTRGRRCAWPTSLWHDESPVVASPRQILRAPARPARRARLVGAGGHGARVHRVPRHLRGGVRQGLQGPRARQPVQRRLLDPRHLAARAAARADPARDGGRRPRGGELQGRVQLRPARDQLHLRGRARRRRHARRSTRTAPRRSPSQEGMAITFMAKYDEREGNSCHIHLSLRGKDDKPVFADQPELFDRFLAGQLACLRELTLFLAPNINSYKRFAEGSFAPTAVAWGRDNRTCSMRVIGHGPALRIENRARRRRRQPLPRDRGDDRRGAARRSTTSSSSSRRSRATRTRPTSRTCRARCRRRATCSPTATWRARRSARTSSRTTSTYADVELRAFEAAVTDWERVRGFERL